MVAVVTTGNQFNPSTVSKQYVPERAVTDTRSCDKMQKKPIMESEQSPRSDSGFACPGQVYADLLYGNPSSNTKRLLNQ